MKNTLLLLVLTITLLNAGAQINSSDSIQVRLKSLEADRSGNQNRLQWTVACFLDHAQFEVQRSSNGTDYQTIHRFEADQLRCLSPFEFTEPATTGDRAFYRIRVGDLDGRFYSSKTVVTYGKTNAFDITGISPSIVQNNTQLSISSASADRATLLLRSAAGVILVRKELVLQKGQQTIQLDLSQLAAGIHYLTVSTSNGLIRSSALVKR